MTSLRVDDGAARHDEQPDLHSNRVQGSSSSVIEAAQRRNHLSSTAS